MKKAILIGLLCLFTPLLSLQLSAQCTLLPNAVPGITLTYQNTSLLNCSGVAYNPNRDLYYAVRAGNPGFPLETWDGVGTPLYTTSAGFDWRGMWWNPNTSQLEGNGYNSSGMWRADLNASGFALNTGAYIFTGYSQPNSQSCGDLDYHTNEVVYYYNGNIYRYDRATNAFLGNYSISGLPAATSALNWTTVIYTGCTGMEIGLLDYQNKRIYLINKATGAYSGMSQLPGTAVTTNGFRFSYANDLVWLFDLSTYTWYSYRIWDAILPANVTEFEASRDASGLARLRWEADNEQQLSHYELQRSVDGVDFSAVYQTDAAHKQDNAYGYTDAEAHGNQRWYYRLNMVDEDGGSHFSRIAILEPGGAAKARLYPNPANSLLHVELPEGATQVHVMNELGQEVTALETGGAEKLDLNTSGYAPGLYFLSWRDAAGGIHTERFSISR